MTATSTLSAMEPPDIAPGSSIVQPRLDADANLKYLATIINLLPKRSSGHWYLRRRQHNNAPWFYSRAARQAFDGRVPWWVSQKRRLSYENLMKLIELGTSTNLKRLLEGGLVTTDRLKELAKRRQLPHTLRAHMREARRLYEPKTKSASLALAESPVTVAADPPDRRRLVDTGELNAVVADWAQTVTQSVGSRP